MLKKILYIASFVITFCVSANNSAFAQFEEYEIKAVQLYTFAKYVTWPEKIFKGQSKIILGVLGDDPFGDKLDKVLKNRPVNGKLWEIRRAHTSKELRGCHIIFVCKSEEPIIKKIMEELSGYRNSSVLTIGDNIHKFCGYGGIINFTEEKYLFEINLKAATDSDLVLSTQLLRIAKAIVSYEK